MGENKDNTVFETAKIKHLCQILRWYGCWIISAASILFQRLKYVNYEEADDEDRPALEEFRAVLLKEGF